MQRGQPAELIGKEMVLFACLVAALILWLFPLILKLGKLVAGETNVLSHVLIDMLEEQVR